MATVVTMAAAMVAGVVLARGSWPVRLWPALAAPDYYGPGPTATLMRREPPITGRGIAIITPVAANRGVAGLSGPVTTFPAPIIDGSRGRFKFKKEQAISLTNFTGG